MTSRLGLEVQEAEGLALLPSLSFLVLLLLGRLALVVDLVGLRTTLCQSEAVLVAVVATLPALQLVTVRLQLAVLATMGAMPLPLQELTRAQVAGAVRLHPAEMEPQAQVALGGRGLRHQFLGHRLLMPAGAVAGFAWVRLALVALAVVALGELGQEAMEPRTQAVVGAVEVPATVAPVVQAFSF